MQLNPTRPCPHCGGPITRKSSRVKFCSNSCAIEAYREKARQNTRAWVSANPAKDKATRAKCRAKNPERYRLAERRRKLANRDKELERKRLYNLRNSKKHCQANRRWRKANPDKWSAIAKTSQARRSAKKRGNGGSFTYEEWSLLVAITGRKCLKCMVPGTTGSLSVDHVVPLSKGGSNDIMNIQPLCKKCNQCKSAQWVDYRTDAHIRKMNKTFRPQLSLS